MTTTTPQRYKRKVREAHAIEFDGTKESSAAIREWLEPLGYVVAYRPGRTGTNSEAMPAVEPKLILVEGPGVTSSPGIGVGKYLILIGGKVAVVTAKELGDEWEADYSEPAPSPLESLLGFGESILAPEEDTSNEGTQADNGHAPDGAFPDLEIPEPPAPGAGLLDIMPSQPTVVDPPTVMAPVPEVVDAPITHAWDEESGTHVQLPAPDDDPTEANEQMAELRGTDASLDTDGGA